MSRTSVRQQVQCLVAPACAACVVFALLGQGAGCASPGAAAGRKAPLTPAERTAMQCRTFEAPPAAVFAATVDALQEQAWQIVSADKNSGIIKAATAKRPEILSPSEERIMDYSVRRRLIREREGSPERWTRWEEMTIHTEPWGAKGTRQRVIYLRRGTLPPVSYQRTVGGGLFHASRQVTVSSPPGEEAVEVDVPEAYETFFAKVEAGVRARSAAP